MAALVNIASGRISVIFENRSDGGLRVYSDDVPGFVLSHPDRSAVLADVQPALETILGEMMGCRVEVTPLDHGTAMPWFHAAERKRLEYVAQRVA